jgi:hypothetical protein
MTSALQSSGRSFHVVEDGCDEGSDEDDRQDDTRDETDERGRNMGKRALRLRSSNNAQAEAVQLLNTI